MPILAFSGYRVSGYRVLEIMRNFILTWGRYISEGYFYFLSYRITREHTRNCFLMTRPDYISLHHWKTYEDQLHWKLIVKDIYLLYKYQWNTRWAFARKHDIFTCENNMLSSHVKRSRLLWLHDTSCLRSKKNVKVKWFGISLVFI